MTADYGVNSGHTEYSNHRFREDTRHLVIIEVPKHMAELDTFQYELPVYAPDCLYRARLFLSEEGYKTIRALERKGMLTILHHANVVGGYIVDDQKPKKRKRRTAEIKEEMQL